MQDPETPYDEFDGAFLQNAKLLHEAHQHVKGLTDERNTLIAQLAIERGLSRGAIRTKLVQICIEYGLPTEGLSESNIRQALSSAASAAKEAAREAEIEAEVEARLAAALAKTRE